MYALLLTGMMYIDIELFKKGLSTIFFVILNVNRLNSKILDYRETQWTQLLFSIGVIHNVLYTIFMHPPTTCTFKPFSACSNVITVLAEASTAFFSVYAFIKTTQTRCFSLWFCGERCRLRTPRSGCSLLSRRHSCLLLVFSCFPGFLSCLFFCF